MNRTLTTAQRGVVRHGKKGPAVATRRNRSGLFGRAQRIAGRIALAVAFTHVGGCAEPTTQPAERPDVSPIGRVSEADSLLLDASNVLPMYRELVAIDLPAIVRLASADNIEIRLSKYQVQQSKGRLESVVGGVFPALVPNAIFERLDGGFRNTDGRIFDVGINSFQMGIALQWIINPGSVVYEIIASKKRLAASRHRERSVQMEVLRTAATQFYGLVLTQARVSAAYQAVTEAEELLRINQLRARTGTAVPADELRAEAELAERHQDLALAMNALYNASLALTETLQLEDPTTTLIPKMDSLPPINLVRADYPIDELLAIAVQFRPDLEALRVLAEAAGADRGATWWGGFGPQFEVGYRYGGITGHANNVDKGTGVPGNLIINPLSSSGAFSGNPVVNGFVKEGIARLSRRAEGDGDRTYKFRDQRRAHVGVGAKWSLSAFGDLKSADAVEQQSVLQAEQMLLRVKTQVVRAQQASRTNLSLIAMAKRQMDAAEEALRLTRASLQAGAMTTLDVLHAQDAVARARLRHAEAVVRYNQAEVDLLAALGLLDMSSLLAADGESVAQT
ncbi:MAG: TolC family protein [Planctomycetota bacterium]|nr:TolC family protein [Planctomycetota bacterium]